MISVFAGGAATRRLAVLLGQRAELARDGAAQLVQAGELDDPVEVLLLERRHLDADPLERAPLGAAAAEVAGEHVAGDAEQPRRHLLVGRAPRQEKQDRARVGAVHGRELVGGHAR
jgi:hypothetical protein